jgi:hypothetical protein
MQNPEVQLQISDGAHQIRARKRTILFVLAVLWFVMGLADGWFEIHYPEVKLQDLLVAGGIAYLSLEWIRPDARQNDYQLTAIMAVLVFALWFVGYPCYFIASRGLKGGLISSGKALAMLLGLILCMGAGILLIQNIT